MDRLVILQRINELRLRVRKLQQDGVDLGDVASDDRHNMSGQLDHLLDDLESTAVLMADDHARLPALLTAISAALALPQSIPAILQRCTEALVQHLDAAFARVWLLDTATLTLHLQASAGQYTHLNGPHSRVPVGQFKIGRIAQSRRPHLTNEVSTDCEIGDPLWAAREGMVSFAGYPLLVDDRLVGVMALFARAPLAADILDTLAAIAEGVAQGIERRRTEEALQQAQIRLEQRVAERTAELAAVNRHLQESIDAHLNAESAIRFQAHLLNTVEQAVIATDPNGCITYWNRFAETLYGWPAADAIGQLVIDVVPAQSTQAQGVEIMNNLLAGRSWSGEFVVRRRDGTTFIAMVTDAPVYDEHGILVGVVGVSSDITVSKRAAEASRFLADASALLTASLDEHSTLPNLARLAIPRIADCCSIHLRGADNAIELVALAHVDPMQETLLHDIRNRYPVDPERLTGIARVLHTGQPELYEHITDELLSTFATTSEYRNALHQLGMTSMMLIPLASRGHTIGVISFFVKGSERSFLQSDLDLAQQVAERAALALENARLYQAAKVAVQGRDDFLSIAAHELKTPVTTLLGYSQTLHRRAVREDLWNQRDRRSLQIIASQAERLGRLITTLFDISRIESGQFTLMLEPLDLALLARRTVDESQPALVRHTLELELNDQPLLIEGDAMRLEQVLQNLIGNAVKYSPDGGIVKVRAERRENAAVLAVIDHGIGIVETAQHHIFDRFYRASNNAGGPIGGLGIGLYVVKEIVTRHGGQVTVASIPGQGTTLTISIPLLSPLPPPDS
ncbi:MAG: hypothetical protein NVSMB42_16830 [Herpetosiphon sp.]